MEKDHSNMIISTKDLGIGYQGKKKMTLIQRKIDIEICQGDFMVVLGRNGIGKSTFLRTITKVQPPLEGAVFLGQKELHAIDDRILSKKMSIVLTDRIPDSQLTVFELVALGRQPYTNWIGKLTSEDYQKVTWAMEETDTLALSNCHFYELSDGQLQRVLIARALAQDTEIIVLDEPTAHLDLHHTIKIFQLLERLVREMKKTIILSSHQVNLAIRYANNIILMTNNRVISGSRASLQEDQAFDDLFPSEILNFDGTLEQFVVQKK